MTLYEFLKYIHVVLAIIAIGFNASYGIWLTRAAKEPEHAGHVLRGVKVLDDRFANPAYGLLLVTGVSMVLLEDIPFSTFWIAAGLALYVVAVIGGLFGYTPILRNQILLLEAGKSDSEEFQKLSKRGALIGILLAIDVLTIEFLMVTKPTL
ncbi:MAG: DUF2269 domain-containing protein [Actinomycetota bacterium]|nr:DUF2269 domain-containing protein [Actinomycetota bacterium]